MICKYCEISKYETPCVCQHTGEICAFMRRCHTSRCWKPLNSMENCRLRKEKTLTPMGMNRVRFELSGELYVEIGDFVYRIKNPFDYTPEFVETVKRDGQYYIKGFEPKKKTEKVRREKDVEKNPDKEPIINHSEENDDIKVVE